ncbi:hypothetical protein [Methanobacterium sp.]|uniref:hypothetical protein n=1 Tax=Methanobacterium sp. TaxID=2164 RepID=UPI003C78C0E4
MIGATITEFETQTQVKFNLRDFLDTLIQKNGRGSKSRRIQRFCDKYNFSQAEYESIMDKISSNHFQVIV